MLKLTVIINHYRKTNQTINMKLLITLSCLIAVSYSRVPFSVSSSRAAKFERSAAPKVNQFMDGYNYSNQGGDSVRAIDYIPNLADYNMDNRITSVCVTGIWLMYADSNYNVNNLKASNYWVYGDNYCTDVPAGFNDMASSLRYTGAPDEWKADTLNMYLNPYFAGGEEYTYVDLPQVNYDDSAQSIIVTGCSAWTLYSNRNYGGSCMCVYPSDTSKCFPGFYTTPSSLGFLAGQVSSARRGCYCSNKAFPDNYGEKSQQNFEL